MIKLVALGDRVDILTSELESSGTTPSGGRALFNHSSSTIFHHRPFAQHHILIFVDVDLSILPRWLGALRLWRIRSSTRRLRAVSGCLEQNCRGV